MSAVASGSLAFARIFLARYGALFTCAKGVDDLKDGSLTALGCGPTVAVGWRRCQREGDHNTGECVQSDFHAGRNRAMRRKLEPVYGWFTEGFGVNDRSQIGPTIRQRGREGL
jgi:hypothetical protein